MNFITVDGKEVVDPYLTFDSSGRVRWYYYDNATGYTCMVVPEPIVPAQLVRAFIKAHPAAGWDIGEMTDQEAMQYSIVN